MELLDRRRDELVDKLKDAQIFLMKTAADLDRNNKHCFHHLNERLLIQVHLMDVLEASKAYDREVWEALRMPEVASGG